MKVQQQHYRTIWSDNAGDSVHIIDQTKLPHEFVIVDLQNVADAIRAISDMLVRGAPLIGATAAFGIYLAMRADGSEVALRRAAESLKASRPTAVNLRWAVDLMLAELTPLSTNRRADRAFEVATRICNDDVEICRSIGQHGLSIIQDIADTKPNESVNILTHCNAGWLATVDWGTALAPVYSAFEAGVPIHVWVDETRPRNQGAHLTAWELAEQGVDHTLVVDNAGGHLMQHGLVDVCIVGTDRTAASGDVCNKIGTYLKALAAYDNKIPFYVGLPSPTIDWTIADGVVEIPIEQRSAEEVTQVQGLSDSGEVTSVMVAEGRTQASNFAFDVTPARLVSGFITERGVCPASADGLASLFPDMTHG